MGFGLTDHKRQPSLRARGACGPRVFMCALHHLELIHRIVLDDCTSKKDSACKLSRCKTQSGRQAHKYILVPVTQRPPPKKDKRTQTHPTTPQYSLYLSDAQWYTLTISEGLCLRLHVAICKNDFRPSVFPSPQKLAPKQVNSCRLCFAW